MWPQRRPCHSGLLNSQLDSSKEENKTLSDTVLDQSQRIKLLESQLAVAQEQLINAQEDADTKEKAHTVKLDQMMRDHAAQGSRYCCTCDGPTSHPSPCAHPATGDIAESTWQEGRMSAHEPFAEQDP